MGNAHKDLVGEHGKERPLMKSKPDRRTALRCNRNTQAGMIWAGLISRHKQAVLGTTENFS
jgi:hypothetical protein